ncbi:MAG: dihydropteroate synthase [Candidatus Cloacimonetes bacterium]|nr:dihydropteroate synthase [Candidatus Cloacimonadota bacterium]
MNRILTVINAEAAQSELKKINVSSGGIESMYPKMNGICLKLENVHLAAANILKQEMLSLGGDAAVARGVVNGTVPESEVILIGNEIKLKRLADKLAWQQFFKLPQIRLDILRLLQNRSGRAISNRIINGKPLDLHETQIMGVLNVTPDSFSDGNKYLEPEAALQQALKMEAEGAVIIDIGGESTRPGAAAVSAQEEIARVVEVIKKIRQHSKVIISIDTTKAEVARAALTAGADMINDISALRFDPEMIRVLQDFPQTGIILMHMQGTPQTMQQKPEYDDTIREILSFLGERIDYATSRGIERQRIFIDPGIGFGKRHSDNLIILQRLAEFHCLDCPVLLAASRKSFIGKIYVSTAEDREEGTLAATAMAASAGVHLVRVHDVKQNQRLLQVMQAVRNAQ